MIQDSTYEKAPGYSSCSEWREELIARVDDTNFLYVFAEKALISTPPMVQIFKDNGKYSNWSKELTILKHVIGSGKFTGPSK